MTTTKSQPTTEKRTRYPFTQAHPRLSVVLAVVLFAGLAVAGWRVFVSLRPDRPVYVTDGTHIFNENLRAVEELILRENQRVAGGKIPYVSIAYADVMNPEPSGNAINADLTRHDLEGAYLAQLAWNQGGGKPPGVLVRLLLADQGTQGDNWLATSDVLAAAVGSADHLVAVTGLGISVDTTRRLIDRLSANKIGIVSAALTGNSMTESLDGRPVRGMVRVGPTNSNEAEAAVRFIDAAPDLPEQPAIMLVQDQSRADEYAKSLGEAFTRAIAAGTRRGATLTGSTIIFDSSLGDAAMILGANAEKVCSAHADIVYFAGREGDLQGFLAGLAGRSCAKSRHLTVISGDAVSHLSGRTLWQGNDANLNVIFTSLSHPDLWTQHPEAVNQQAAARFGTCGTCFYGLFRDESRTALEDNGAIMSHDAVWTAIKAIEFTRSTHPSASGVAQALPQLRLGLASGWICEFDTNHNPNYKAIPMMQIGQAGTLKYVTLSSAGGNASTECPS